MKNVATNFPLAYATFRQWLNIRGITMTDPSGNKIGITNRNDLDGDLFVHLPFEMYSGIVDEFLNSKGIFIVISPNGMMEDWKEGKLQWHYKDGFNAEIMRCDHITIDIEGCTSVKEAKLKAFETCFKIIDRQSREANKFSQAT